MKAWHFHGTNKPFEKVLDKVEPEVTPGNVKVAVKAAGICHSDVGIMEDENWMALFPSLPVSPGHENAGVVEELGDGVEGFEVGDRVAVWPMNGPVGYGIDGGWQEKIVVPEDSLVKVPEGVSWAAAAAATDAGMTSHGAVIGTGKVQAGEKVAIIGFGGLGQIGARIAHLNGAELYVAEINEAVHERATEAGAVKVVKDIRDLADVGLDVVIDFAGFGTTTQGALEVLRPGGRVVVVGMGKLEFEFNAYPLIVGARQMLGSNGGTVDDIRSVLEWIGKGEISPTIETITWDDIAEGVDRLNRGDVKGRLVALYE